MSSVNLWQPEIGHNLRPSQTLTHSFSPPPDWLCFPHWPRVGSCLESQLASFGRTVQSLPPKSEPLCEVKDMTERCTTRRRCDRYRSGRAVVLARGGLPEFDLPVRDAPPATQSQPSHPAMPESLRKANCGRASGKTFWRFRREPTGRSEVPVARRSSWVRRQPHCSHDGKPRVSSGRSE